VNNKTASRNFALLIGTTLLALMLIAPASVLPFGLTPAFADVSNVYKILRADILLTQDENNDNEEENNDNEEVSGGGNVVNTMVQESIQGGTNTNQDNDVIVGRCDDGNIEVNDNDEVIQGNIQSANQEANSNNKARYGGNIVNIAEELSTQVATNINLDNDLVFILDCHGGNIEVNDNDEVIQGNIQSANQEAIFITR
jgi:hypothetical protein